MLNMTKRLFCMMAFLLSALVASYADDTKLPQIVITTNNKIGDSKYVSGTISITDTDGKIVTLNAKYRQRGATSAQYTSKPSLNVKLRDESGESLDSCLLGLRSCSKWILDAMAIDRICMRNRVAMDIWNDYASLPYTTSFPVISSTGQTIYRSGTIGRFVEVTINGDYKGIYALSDHINRKLLDLKKVDEDDETGGYTVRGVLYKSGTTDIQNQNSPEFLPDYTACTAEYHNAWELKEPEDYECYEAWEPLLDALGSSLASGNGVKIKSYELVKKYFDIDNLIDYQLHVMALAISDNWGNKNHFFSIRNIQKDINDEDPEEAAKRKFIISPWDLDTSFGGHYNGNYYDGTYQEEFTPASAIRNGGCFPFSLCQGSNEYKTRMKERWEELRVTTYLPENINARLESVRDLFVNSGAWERNGSIQPKYVDDLAKEVDYVEEWYARRYAIMDEHFGIVDAIHDVTTTDTDTDIFYTLDGIKVTSPKSPGLYINAKNRKVVRF